MSKKKEKENNLPDFNFGIDPVQYYINLEKKKAQLIKDSIDQDTKRLEISRDNNQEVTDIDYEEAGKVNNESSDSNYFIPKADGNGLFNQLNGDEKVSFRRGRKNKVINSEPSYEDFLDPTPATPINKTDGEFATFLYNKYTSGLIQDNTIKTPDVIDYINNEREERIALYYDELITKEAYITYNGIIKVKYFDDSLLAQETVESNNIRYYVELKDPSRGHITEKVDFNTWIELSVQGTHYCYFEIIDKNLIETQPKPNSKKNPFISELVHLATYEFKHDCKCEDIKDCTGKCNLTNEEFQEKLLEILNKYNKQENEL